MGGGPAALRRRVDGVGVCVSVRVCVRGVGVCAGGRGRARGEGDHPLPCMRSLPSERKRGTAKTSFAVFVYIKAHDKETDKFIFIFSFYFFYFNCFSSLLFFIL